MHRVWILLAALCLGGCARGGSPPGPPPEKGGAQDAAPAVTPPQKAPPPQAPAPAAPTRDAGALGESLLAAAAKTAFSPAGPPRAIDASASFAAVLERRLEGAPACYLVLAACDGGDPAPGLRVVDGAGREQPAADAAAQVPAAPAMKALLVCPQAACDCRVELSSPLPRACAALIMGN